ncbi:shikimate dehydrogenase [Lacticaseibacillus sp. N501-2]|uniref:shikimate dehydrogenase n=1 Tax=Lacticaseibacillus salsurae TaxID=3367729 RepID=UPI0038B294E4
MANYRPELVGLLGDPVDDNPTGVMEEAAFADLKMNWRYITCKVRPSELLEAVAGAKAMGWRGFNLTMPHKIAVLPMLDELSPAAKMIGAVNCVINDHGKLLGENSDGKGFTTSLTDAGISLAGKRIVMLGAGGVARAIAVESALAGASHFTIYNITEGLGLDLAELINNQTDASAEFHLQSKTIEIPSDTDILINCTPLGLKPNDDLAPDINYQRITNRMDVADVVFNPAISRFLQLAKVHGAHQIVGGLNMLAAQGAMNFQLWSGQKPNQEVMRQTLKEEFSQQ